MRPIDADEIEYERAHLIYPDGSKCLGYYDLEVYFYDSYQKEAT